MSDCQLAKYNQCCCNCEYRLKLLDHNAFPKDIQIGWACIGFAFMETRDIAYLGDFEHGMCELHILRLITTSP